MFGDWAGLNTSRGSRGRRNAIAGMSRRQQKVLINGVFLILALLPFLVASLYFHWSSWAIAAVLGVFAVSAYSLVSTNIPKKTLSYPEFIHGLSSAVMSALIPLAAMALLYAALTFFKVAGAATINTAVAIGGAVLAFFLSLPSVPQAAQDLGYFVRGRSQPSQINGKDIQLALDANDPGILWGGVRLPSRAATSHFMVVGTTGSGKTITLRLLMQRVLRTIGSAENHRALIYDAKQDLASVLGGMGLPRTCPIYTLNPFDTRCVCWDMAKDVRDLATAFQTATLLAPSDKNASQPFFTDSTQLLLYGVLVAFLTRGDKWTFSDVVRTMQSADVIRAVLESTPETKPIADRFFGNPETLQNIMATVATKMVIYEPIAAMWEKAYKAGNRVSLSDWILNKGDTDARGKPVTRDNYILLLGNSETARKALDAINRVLFQRITELLLNQSENRDDTRRTWIFLDEVAEAGELAGLMSLLAKGRSKGVCVVLGFQDIEALREVYGEKIAHALTGQCNNKAILRLESPATAEWASKLFGAYEAVEERYSHGEGGGGSNWSYAQEYVNRQSVLESQFYLLPVINQKNGLSGYYIVQEVGAYHHTYAGHKLFGTSAQDPNKLLMPPVEDVKDIEARGGSEQRLPRWGVLDFVRLKIPQLARAVKSVASTNAAHIGRPASVPAAAPPATAAAAATGTGAGTDTETVTSAGAAAAPPPRILPRTRQ